MIDQISATALLPASDEKRRKCFSPPSIMRPEEWAEEIYRLPNGVRFRWDYAPFSLGMFRSIWDRRSRETVYQCFSRGFKTTCTLLAAGYAIDQSPRRILWMWQTMGHAEKFSKEALGGELFDTTPCLNYLSTGNRRLSSNTITFKRYPGGSLNLFGANAPGELRRAKGDMLIADEVDAYEETETDEGDILLILDRRGSEFANTIRIKASYPSLKGRSRIQNLLDESDYNEWWVTCVRCGGEPFVMHRSQLRYEKERPEGARLECPRCKELLTDAERHQMAHKQGFDNWRPRHEFKGRHGFHANAMLWPHAVDPQKYPGGFLAMLAAEEIAAEASDNPMRARRVIVNTMDAEPFDPTLESERAPDWKLLFARRESYGPKVPTGGLYLTAFTDCQKNRLELGWRAYGRREESWGMAHVVLEGYVGHWDVWKELVIELAREWKHESGAIMYIGTGFIDGGAYADDVYRFLVLLSAYFQGDHPSYREARRVFGGIPEESLKRVYGHVRASKGYGIHPHPIVHRKMSTVAKNLKGHGIGTWQAKTRIYERLRYPLSDPLPDGFMHYNERYSEEWFRGLTMETATKEFKNGEEILTYKDEVSGNEALDIEVGCLAALRLYERNWDQLEKALEDQLKEPEPEPINKPLAVAGANGNSWVMGGMRW